MTSKNDSPLTSGRRNMSSSNYGGGVDYEVTTPTTSTPATTTATSNTSSLSRIPLLSPGSFRRSVSLRLRGNKNASSINLGEGGSGSGGVAGGGGRGGGGGGGGGGVDDTTIFSTSHSSFSSKLFESPSTGWNGGGGGGGVGSSFRKSISSVINTAAKSYYNSPTRRKNISGSLSTLNKTAEQKSLSDKSPQFGDSINKLNNKFNNINVSGASVGASAGAAGQNSSAKGCNLDNKINSVIKTDLNSKGMSLNLKGSNVISNSLGSAVGTPKTPYSPRTPSTSALPRTPKTPPVTPDSPNLYLDEDLDSLYSYSSATSGRSTMSCEHPYVARNGTTFSGRKMKYVVHCSSYAGQVGEDYLTPTQRAQRQIRRLKELLSQARQELEQKDSEILRLTREVVELRLFKASLSSPEDRSNSSDAVTVREAATELKTSQDVSPIVDMVDESINKASPRHYATNSSSSSGVLSRNEIHQHQVHLMDKLSNSEMQSSFADSGHFEDTTTSSIHSKDSFSHNLMMQDKASGGSDNDLSAIEEQKRELIRLYEKRIEELIRNQESAATELKCSHNDKVEALLQKLSECNSRYADIVPDYDQAKERIRELEKQLEDLQRKLQEQEDKHNKMYLHMYTKGQEAERLAHAEKVLELAHQAPNRVSIPELLQQLQSTQDELENIRATNCRTECGSSNVLLTAKEAISLWVLGARKTIYRRLLEAQQNRTRVDPEVTLQFLKSAIYYFLTDKENSQGHLHAIESILEFSEQEKDNISKARDN